MKVKIDKFTAFFLACLLAFTTYISLDTFVLSSAYQVEATEINEEAFFKENEDDKNSSENIANNSNENVENNNSSDNSNDKVDADESEQSVSETSLGLTGNVIGEYADENISISLQQFTVHETEVYVADVTVSSAKYLKTALADGTYGKNIKAKTSEMAAENNAILAINGDYYGTRESGYVIRNGVLYRDSQDDSDVLVIYADGSFEIVSAYDVSAEELVAKGAWQAFSFGPALVEDSQVTVGVNEETGRAKASNPRTAIGIIDDLHYVFVVSDGRTNESAGLSLYELGCFMQELGATTAYNLDGGGSSTMVFQGQVINNPTSSGNSIKERSVSDIVYIG